MCQPDKALDLVNPLDPVWNKPGEAVGLISPKMPEIPKIKKPPIVDPAAVSKKQRDAAAKAAIQQAGLYGASDTLLTGPQGIGTVPAANLKTYLGQ